MPRSDDKISAQDIDDFLQIYDRDFSKNSKDKFKSDFENISKNDILKGKKVKIFLNSDDSVTDKFKTYFYSSRFDKWIVTDGSTISYKKADSENEIKKNLKFFDKGYEKIACKQDALRKELYDIIRKKIQKGEISFAKRNKNVSKALFNMPSCQLYDIAYVDKEDIMYRYMTYEPQQSEYFDNAMLKMGFSYDDINEYYKKFGAYDFLYENALSDEQYKKLGTDFSDYEKLEKILNEILTDKQRNRITQLKTDIPSIARTVLKRELYTQYTLANITANYMSDIKGPITREAIINKMTGQISLDGKTKKTLEEIASNVTPYKPSKQDELIFKEVFSNLKVADINTFHDQALDVINVVQKEYKMPKIVINFDSHSDLYLDNAKASSPANWVNHAVSFDEVEKIIWVVPKNSIQNDPRAKYYYVKFSSRDGANIDYTQILDTKKPYIQKLYLDKYSKIIRPVISDVKRKRGIKIIDFIICTEDSLPDLKNQEVFVSIDGDYFNNSGFDTKDSVSTIPFDINKIFSNFINALYRHNIKPDYLSCSLSPEYVSYERVDEVYGFFKYILFKTNIEDSIKSYYGKLTKDITRNDKPVNSAF